MRGLNSSPYLKKYGPKALDNGYQIIPIKPGTKRPPFDQWEDIRADKRTLARWLENGRGDHGVGILACKTPLVDIDCRDRQIVRQMIAFTEKLCGATLQRVGLAPKTGLLYRTDRPFKKVNSKTYVDDEGKTHKVEILGDGQQFVAFAIHPDTKEPYRWTDRKSPHNTAWASLHTLDRDDALEIIGEFERLAEQIGWAEKKTIKRLESNRAPAVIDDDDRDFSDDHPIDITTQELSLKLQLVSGAEDYDSWLQIGMALWHQYEGGDDGRMLWHEWSGKAANYDMEALDAKWPTFQPSKGSQPVTARLIIKLANEEEKRLAGEQVQDTRQEITDARTVEALTEIGHAIKHLAFIPLVRESIGNLIRKRYKEITGDTMSTATVRQLIRYENPENKRKPKWLEPFCYVSKDKVFYHLENRMELDREAFDAEFNRFMMTQRDRLEGRSSPEHSASTAALNLWEIEIVYRRMYMPDEPLFFTHSGQRFVNSYSEIGIPEPPTTLTSLDRQAIARVEGHLAHLFVHERARKLLLDWIAYVVQTKKRVSWMPLIQGTEGDGKTFFGELLKTVLGDNNVRIEPGESFQERFNHYLEGVLVVFVEEIRLHGRHRYEALNRLKPWITNERISVRAMHRGSYEIINTASLIAASNHKDAIPAGENDTRYYPMFSRWQTKGSLDAFNAANPDYYQKLYASLLRAGALRKWLLERQLSPDFRPFGRAPESPYRVEMLALNETDLTRAFRESISESTRPDFTEGLLDSALLDETLEARGVEAPRDRARNIFLSEHGFSQFPKKISILGKTRNYWSKQPEHFLIDCEVNRDAVLAWLDPSGI